MRRRCCLKVDLFALEGEGALCLVVGDVLFAAIFMRGKSPPPPVCPVCGAVRSQFVPAETEEISLFHDLVSNFRLHSVVAHFPSGLVPTSALFLLLYFITGHPGLETAVYWLLLVATAVIPVSLASGIYAWQKHFDGRRASIFFKKIGLALTLLLLGHYSSKLVFQWHGHNHK